MTIGQNIRKYRLERGLSQATLAAAVGTTQQQLGVWENGHRYPNYTSLCALCAALGVSANDLFGETEQERDDNANQE